MSLLELYCAIDDFCQAMEKEQIGRLLTAIVKSLAEGITAANAIKTPLRTLR